MKDFLAASAAVLGLFTVDPAAVNALQHASWKTRGFYGPGRREHRVLPGSSRGAHAFYVVKTRQIERAEVRAEAKKFDSRVKRSQRDEAGKALSQRVGEREARELDRRDARFGVHDMIEQSRRRGTLCRALFA